MRIAIASCADITEVPDQPVWRRIQDAAPGLLLLLGDQVYYNKLSHNPGASPQAFEQRMRSQYERQWAEPHFRALLQSGIPWTAVWDDHDYAWNNAGGEVDADRKERTRRLFLEFQGGTIVPARDTIHHDFMRDGVQFVMLDGRSWREAPGPQATPLGASQEAYLWERLSQPADVHLVACGSPLTFGRYCLSEYPSFTTRLADFLRQRRLNVIFVGGDIHDNTWTVHERIIELVSSGVARRYGLASKRNYALLDLDLNSRIAVFEAYSQDKPLAPRFDLSTWAEI